MILKLSLSFNLNQIRVSEFSIGFHLSYLNDLTRSSMKGLLFVTSEPRHIECSNLTKVRWVLKTHQLTNLWVIHFKERAFFWPCVCAPLQTANLFFPSCAMFYYTFYFSVTLFVVLYWKHSRYIIAFDKSWLGENQLAFLSILLYIWEKWILSALAKRKSSMSLC